MSESYTPPPAVSKVSLPVVGNPFTGLADFIGSANVQKVLGLVQTGVAATTGAEGKTLAAHISGMTIGTAYAAFIHVVDAVRAWIDKKS